jgi:hypothetical protein
VHSRVKWSSVLGGSKQLENRVRELVLEREEARAMYGLPRVILAHVLPHLVSRSVDHTQPSSSVLRRKKPTVESEPLSPERVGMVNKPQRSPCAWRERD